MIYAPFVIYVAVIIIATATVSSKKFRKLLGVLLCGAAAFAAYFIVFWGLC